MARFRNALKGTNVGAITATNGTGSATGSVAETIARGSRTAVAADGIYKIPVSSTKILYLRGAPSSISVVGNGNVYSVEGI